MLALALTSKYEARVQPNGAVSKTSDSYTCCFLTIIFWGIFVTKILIETGIAGENEKG